MTDVTKSSNEYFLTRAQYNARKSAGTLEVGAVYHITDENYVSKVNNVGPDSSGNVTLYSNNILNGPGGTSTVEEQILLAYSTANTAIETANSSVHLAGTQTITGNKTFSSAVTFNNGMKGIASNLILSLPVSTTAGTKTLATTDLYTYQTTAPTSAISDGGIHIVYLTSEPTTKYNGYIYLIAES